MEWWKELNDEQIMRLKDNYMPAMMLTPWAWEAFKSMEKENRQTLLSDGRWVGHCSTSIIPGEIHRLRQDWQRPETKWSAILEDAKKKVYQQGHWKEREIYNIGETYKFELHGSSFFLENAFSMVGFGGIQFEDEGGWFFYLMSDWGLDQYSTDGHLYDEPGKPAVPKKVRFWVEG